MQRNYFCTLLYFGYTVITNNAILYQSCVHACYFSKTLHKQATSQHTAHSIFHSLTHTRLGARVPVSGVQCALLLHTTLWGIIY